MYRPFGIFGLAAVLATVLTCAVRAQVPPNADTLVTQYFTAATDEERASVLDAIRQRKDITVAQVEDAVRRGVFYQPQESGTFTRKIKVEFDGSECDCTFYIPPGYDPKKSYPALVALHGTGGTGADSLNRWLPWVKDREMIVIAPTAVSGIDRATGKPFGKGHGYGAHEVERSVPVSAVDAARRTYHIDSDRVYITGVSMGGHGAWDCILTRTDCFAGGITEAGIPLVEGFQLAKYMFLPNLFGVRMWVMQGTPDKDQPKVNAQATLLLQRMGYGVVYREYPLAGHGSYPEESDKALDYVMENRRDVYAKKVKKIVHHAIHGRCCWLRVDKLRGIEWNPMQRINVKVDGPIGEGELLSEVEKRLRAQLGWVEAEVLDDNVIDVKTQNVGQMTVFLHDRLVDMDKPVTIRVNGHIRFRQTFRRDVGVLLEEARESGDTGRIFHNRITFNAT